MKSDPDIGLWWVNPPLITLTIKEPNMRTEIYNCDRCGKVMDKGDYRASITFNGTRNIDLCKLCLKGFDKWVKDFSNESL